MRAFVVAAIVSLATAVAGCGPVCNSSSLCSVTGGTGIEEQVCDGNNFRSCDQNDQGLTIGCMARNQVAVCTPNGWAFQTAGPGGSGGGTP
jgi:hypothetical protein